MDIKSGVWELWYRVRGEECTSGPFFMEWCRAISEAMDGDDLLVSDGEGWRQGLAEFVDVPQRLSWEEFC